MPSQPDGPSYQKNVYVVIEMMKRAADHAARGILQFVLTSTLIGCATVMAGDLVKKPVSRDTFSDPALAEFSLEQPVLPGNPMGGPVTEYLGDQTEYLGDQTEYLGDQTSISVTRTVRRAARLAATRCRGVLADSGEMSTICCGGRKDRRCRHW